jgi:hypothetical protein
MHGYHARTTDTEETGAMELGSAVDAIIFGTRQVIPWLGKQRRGKEYEAFAAERPGQLIMTVKEYDKARRMVDAIMQCDLAVPLLKGTSQETMLFKWYGLHCRTTPDVRGPDFLTELKTSVSSDPVKFLWHARRMAYHAQMRFQQYGCEKHGHKIVDHWIVCCEAEAPHPVTVFHVEPEALEEGDKLLTLWAERLKACEAAESYPPYVDCAVPLVWPKEEVFEFEEAE